ncbi:MAG: hypothetical protein JKY81_02310 [Colwellia sp.]|nr:hypothetical protein [Colwellia sp.]
MGRRSVDVEITTFIRGLITEAGPLTFPENASLSESNFVLNRDGSRQRRLGMDYEDSKTLIDSQADLDTDVSTAIQSFVWENAANDGSLDILVVQVGRNLFFFDKDRPTISDSLLLTGGWTDQNGSPQVIQYIPFVPDGAFSYFAFTSIQGNLIISEDESHFHRLTYDKETDSIVKDTLTIEVRDIWGIEIPSIDVDQRPTPADLTSISPAQVETYKYNIANQGWSGTRNKPTAEPNLFGGAIQTILSGTGTYPSPSDIMWASKDSAGVITVDAFRKQVQGTTPAPKGKFILDDVFRRGEDGGSVLPGGLIDRTEGAIVALESYAGRVWYGLREDKVVEVDNLAPKLGTMVFFSKVVSGREDVNVCHSVADPTSEDTVGVVDSDGGFVSIPDMGLLIGLKTIGNSLFILSTNGVWEVHGGGESPFSATNQTVDKVTEVGCLSSRSIVVAEGTVLYWAESGIYAISKDEVSLRGKATNITKGTIQGFYEGIDNDSRSRSQSLYDPVSRQVRWQYGFGEINPHFRNRELILDIDLQAFYTSDLGTPSSLGPFLVDGTLLSSTIYNDTSDNVVVGGDTVVIGVDTVVSSGRTILEGAKGSAKYLAFEKDISDGKWYFSFANYRDASFHDWKSYDSVGVDAKGSLLTGFLTAGVASKDKKTPYLVTHCRLTEEGFTDDGLGNLTPIGPSSCKVQAQWEWTNNDSAGRWGPKFEAYRLPRYFGPTGASDPFDYGFTVVTTKSKLRGKGRALSLLFETEEDKDLHLYGWGHTLNIENK